MLQQRNLDIVKQAAALLGQTGPIAIEPLARLLHSADPGLRFSAVRGLTQINDSRARAVLRQHLLRENNIEVRALIAAAGLGGEHV